MRWYNSMIIMSGSVALYLSFHKELHPIMTGLIIGGLIHSIVEELKPLVVIHADSLVAHPGMDSRSDAGKPHA